MNKYDKILKRFTGDYNIHVLWCEKPFKHGDSIIATDLYILIRIDATKCEGEYNSHPNQPKKIDELFPTPNCNLVMNVHEIAKLINAVEAEITIPVSGEDAKCPECGGRGTVECKYKSHNGIRHADFDCPKCNGRGHVTHKTVERDERNININGIDFNIGIIMHIADAIHRLGHVEANVVALRDDKEMMISVEPGVDILAMSNHFGKPATSITLKSSDK